MQWVCRLCAALTFGRMWPYFKATIALLFGFILSNFQELATGFKYLGEKVMLMGSQDEKVTYINASKMDEFLR